MDVKVSNPGVAPFARAILVYCRERKSGISRMHKDRVPKNCVSTERGSVCIPTANGFQAIIGVRIDSKALLFCARDCRGKRVFRRSLTITGGLLKSRLPSNYPARNKVSLKRVNIHIIPASP